MTETLQRLFQRVSRDALLGALVRLYGLPESELDDYEEALDLIDATQPARTGAINIIVVEMIREKDGGMWANVSAIEPGYDGKVAIEFSPWSEWLPAIVRRGQDAENLTDAEMLAHILWEMTWIAFDPRVIAERREAVFGSIDELKAALSDAE